MKSIIKNYLENFAKENNWSKYDESKLDECCRYIRNEAKKQAKNGAAVIEDKVVFGWAVHFFDEDGNVEIKAVKLSAPVEEKKEEVQEVTMVETKPKKAPKKVKEPEYEEFSLF